MVAGERGGEGRDGEWGTRDLKAMTQVYRTLQWWIYLIIP